MESAVGTETGELEMSVLIPPGISNYQNRKVATKEFIAFLREDVRMTFIDHLWIDNEGE